MELEQLCPYFENKTWYQDRLKAIYITQMLFFNRLYVCNTHIQRKCYHCALLIMQIKNISVRLNAFEITHLQVLGHLPPLRGKKRKITVPHLKNCIKLNQKLIYCMFSILLYLLDQCCSQSVCLLVSVLSQWYTLFFFKYKVSSAECYILFYSIVSLFYCTPHFCL